MQSDAAYNLGNCGGPLLHAYGRVIDNEYRDPTGNTAILPAGQKLDLAVAANSIRRLVSDLQAHGHVIRPWIGVSLVVLNPSTA